MLTISDIPADFPVRPLESHQHAECRTTCGTCGLSWDDAIPTAWTPAPSARCPFEYFHDPISCDPDEDPWTEQSVSPTMRKLANTTPLVARLLTLGLSEEMVWEIWHRYACQHYSYSTPSRLQPTEL